MDYSNLRLLSGTVTTDGQVEATVTLTNTGIRPAVETVQVYVADLVTSVTWAERELKSFTQAEVMPGERLDVKLSLPASAYSLVDQHGQRIVESGTFELLVGKLSRGPQMLAAKFRISD